MTDIFDEDWGGVLVPVGPPDTEIPKSKIELRVSAELIANAQLMKIDLQGMVEFFATQIQGMITYPSNYNYFGEKAKA